MYEKYVLLLSMLGMFAFGQFDFDFTQNRVNGWELVVTFR